jgi:hypothetical protein
VDEWQFEWLGFLEADLPEPWKATFESLKNSCHSQPHPEFPYYSMPTGGIQDSQHKTSFEEVRTTSIQQLIALLTNGQGMPSEEQSPSIEAVASALSMRVASEPELIASLAPHVERMEQYGNSGAAAQTANGTKHAAANGNVYKNTGSGWNQTQGTSHNTSSYSGANSAAARGYGGQEKSSGASAFGGGGAGWQSRQESARGSASRGGGGGWGGRR